MCRNATGPTRIPYGVVTNRTGTSALTDKDWQPECEVDLSPPSWEEADNDNEICWHIPTYRHGVCSDSFNFQFFSSLSTNLQLFNNMPKQKTKSHSESLDVGRMFSRHHFWLVLSHSSYCSYIFLSRAIHVVSSGYKRVHASRCE